MILVYKGAFGLPLTAVSNFHFYLYVYIEIKCLQSFNAVQFVNE